MQKFTSLILIVLLGLTHLNGQTGCPGCMVELPETLPEDTIFLADAEPGQVGIQYDSDVGFRLPKSTDPVNAIDPNTPAGINLSKITILDVANVPPGLIWEANQQEFDVSEETDGCVKFCGTPLQPGIYEVEVVIQARVSFVNQTTSFSFPFEIVPAERITEGFTLRDNGNCGESLVAFENNVPSNGNSGITYQWDFGNGRTSELENPEAVLYDSPGQYTVNFEAQIDTIGFILNQAIIREVDCDDFLGRPDLNLKVFDPNGDEIFLSERLSNARLPVVIDLNTQIDTGTYILKVLDDDSGLEGGDKVCGEVAFTQLSNGSLVSNGFEVEINIVNPITTVVSEETIVVNEVPEVPFLAVEESTSNLNTCLGDTTILSVETSESIQWYKDSIPIGEGENQLIVTETGVYWGVVTNLSGCSVISEEFEASFPGLPNEPVFTNDKNLLSIFDESRLPETYQLQWFLEGEPILDATSLNYCINETGNYKLEVLDMETGCFRSFAKDFTFDPDFAGCMTTDLEAEIDQNRIRVFPNPSHGGIFSLELDLKDVQVSVYNNQGQEIISLNKKSGGTINLDLSNYPNGNYWLRVRNEKVNRSLKVMKQ